MPGRDVAVILVGTLVAAAAGAAPRLRGLDPPPRTAVGSVVARASAAPSTPTPASAASSTPTPASAASAPGSPPADDGSRCPPGMARLVRHQGAYCIDRWEASVVVRAGARERPFPGNRRPRGVLSRARAVSRPGVKPQGYVSHDEAAALCAHAGKRLCEIDEWVRACRGPRPSRYPYGDRRARGVCNDRYKVLDHHPVYRLFRRHAPAGSKPSDMWSMRWMNDPRLHELSHTVTKTGAFTGCVNGYGVYDMVGNLHEWVADADGTFFGGYFMDTFQNGEGCSYRTVFHPRTYHDYSTGFRCCADP